MQPLTFSTVLQRLFGRGRGWRRAESGAAAVEFALFTPILCFGLLATVDIGLALHERMAMQHVLRAGAQTAMEDPGVEDVETTVQDTASKNFSVASPDDDTYSTGQSLSVEVDRFCACPDDTGEEVTCSTVCEGTVPTYIYYDIAAAKNFNGSFLPAFGLGASLTVQVR